MRRWKDSTFIFISTTPDHEPGGVEERWLPVMKALCDQGASVRFLCLQGSPAGDMARRSGVQVDPYILDKWNVIRSRSRLRKYLKRYVPVCAHSTGLEADVLLRWAARKVPVVRVAHTLGTELQGTRRRRPIDSLFRRFDELGMRSVAAVFVPTDEIAREVSAAGVSQEAIHLAGQDVSEAELVADHLNLYRSFMARRGAGQ